MYSFFMAMLIGISLSMDAFSLSLLYGMIGVKRKDKVTISLIVGIYHFIMPLLGIYFGKIIIDNFFINLNILVLFIFTAIGIEMIISTLKEEKPKLLTSFYSFLFFGFSVSIDSFSTGIGLNIIELNNFIIAIIFALISGIFTYLGLSMGYKINNKMGKYSSLIGGIMLIGLGIYFSFF